LQQLVVRMYIIDVSESRRRGATGCLWKTWCDGLTQGGVAV
jgi:hypothetical protein